MQIKALMIFPAEYDTFQFSTYAIAYKDITEEEPAPEPTPVVRYPIITNTSLSEKVK